MSDNVVPLHSKRERMLDRVKQLRDLANDIEQSPEDFTMAIALFAQHGDETMVNCGGFADDKAASKYLQAFIRNQGFA